MFLELSKTNEIVTLGQAGSTVILAARLSFVIFVLREEFAFVSDLFQKLPSWKGAAVAGPFCLKKSHRMAYKIVLGRKYKHSTKNSTFK